MCGRPAAPSPATALSSSIVAAKPASRILSRMRPFRSSRARKSRGEDFGELAAQVLQAEAEEVELAGLEGYLDLDAADDAEGGARRRRPRLREGRRPSRGR